MRQQDAIKDKVQKLLNQAADREGTPEGDVFYEKAFELMARYGFEEKDLGPRDDEMTYVSFDLSGTYTDMQMYLLNAIATALHCTTLGAKMPRRIRVERGTVYGLRRHIDRVSLLFSLLNPMMAAQASRIDWPSASRKRSFMQGFATGIYARLSDAESSVAASEPGYGLALIDDSERARAYMHDVVAQNGEFITRSNSRRRLDADAFFDGGDAARGADIGQTRVGARPAIGPAG